MTRKHFRRSEQCHRATISYRTSHLDMTAAAEIVPRHIQEHLNATEYVSLTASTSPSTDQSSTVSVISINKEDFGNRSKVGVVLPTENGLNDTSAEAEAVGSEQFGAEEVEDHEIEQPKVPSPFHFLMYV